MPAYEIEIILSRQLADCLSMPVFITDTTGNLIFYNEPAEKILGARFEDTGGMQAEIWSTIFKQQDETGRLLEPDELPLMRTLKDQCPHHRTFCIVSLKGDRATISVTAYPIISRTGKFLGAVAMFWNEKEL